VQLVLHLPAQQLTSEFALRTTAAAFRSEASRSHVVPTASGGAFHVSTNMWTSYSRRAAFSKGSSLPQGGPCACHDHVEFRLMRTSRQHPQAFAFVSACGASAAC
jgi:hypothetical protein